MVRGIDLLGLFNRPVIQPENHIPVRVKVRPSDRYWFIIDIGENSKGASGIKSNSSYSFRVDVMLADGALNGYADTTPDVSGRLLL